MRIVKNSQIELEEFLEFGREMLSCASIHRRKNDEEIRGNKRIKSEDDDDVDCEERIVCVTSGVSYLGLAIVNRLLARGYSVRVLVHSEEDLGKLREMETRGEMRGSETKIGAVVTKLSEIESLVEAFDGCCGVFHTSAFIDPVGLSGYSKSMAEIEVKASKNVMEACARTASVKKCVLTSSLLACIWRDTSQDDLSSVINQDCWSDESICIEKKLWCALGKLRAEKASWKIAAERGLKLTTICPALITGPEFCCRNSTATIAYLKGAQEMYADGLLATIDVQSLAESHVHVFEAMNKKRALGRYICFDRTIQGEEEAEKLAEKTGIPTNMIIGNASSSDLQPRFKLSDSRISNLMSRPVFPCYNES